MYDRRTTRSRLRLTVSSVIQDEDLLRLVVRASCSNLRKLNHTS